MRPAIDGDRFNVPGRIEAAAGEGAAQEITNLALHIFKGELCEEAPPREALLAWRKASDWRPRDFGKIEQHWLAWIFGKAVVAHADGEIDRRSLPGGRRRDEA